MEEPVIVKVPHPPPAWLAAMIQVGSIGDPP
jgi:hypothetical protein